MPRRRVETLSPAPLDCATAVTARATTSLSISVTMSRVWFPASATSCSWKRALASAERLRVVDGLLLLVDQRAQRRRGRPARPRRGDDARGRGLDQAPRVVHVGERDVARLEHERRGPRRHALVGLVHDDAAQHAAHDGDEALRLEDAQRLAQRGPGDAESLDEVGLVTEGVALGELAADDERAQLVGDLLRLLAGGVFCAFPIGHAGHRIRLRSEGDGCAAHP